MKSSVIVVGAGIGGLVAAVELASAGVDVVIFEQAQHVGGKMDHVCIDGQPIDIGPTVMTMRHVFDDLFARAGRRLDDFVTLHPLTILGRHLWQDAPTLDLYCHVAQNEAAIADAFGGAAAQGYLDFCAYTEKLYDLACGPFLEAPRPNWATAWKTYGMGALAAAWRIDAQRTMMQALQKFFPKTPHLRQLFGRYATYSGGSPYLSPATLNLIAHVERLGVWSVEGGMHRLACGVAALARQLGVRIHFGQSVALALTHLGRACGVQLIDGTVIPSDNIIFNGDVRVVESGQFGIRDRAALRRSNMPAQKHQAPMATGLSAMTWAMRARITGRALSGHTVVFAPDEGKKEFAALFAQGPPCSTPTVYLCAPNRHTPKVCAPDAPIVAADAAPEPLFCLVNARPWRATGHPTPTYWHTAALRQRLAACDVHVAPCSEPYMQTPEDFAGRYPGSDGALYGTPPHSWRSFFSRASSHGPVAGFFYAGGTVHPGPGVPMAARSGILAARAVCQAGKARRACTS